MVKKLKVFGGMLARYEPGRPRQCRAVVATTSQAKAAAIVGVTSYEFRNFWGETGNEYEIKQALANPETRVWIDDDAKRAGHCRLTAMQQAAETARAEGRRAGLLEAAEMAEEAWRTLDIAIADEAESGDYEGELMADAGKHHVKRLWDRLRAKAEEE